MPQSGRKVIAVEKNVELPMLVFKLTMKAVYVVTCVWNLAEKDHKFVIQSPERNTSGQRKNEQLE